MTCRKKIIIGLENKSKLCIKETRFKEIWLALSEERKKNYKNVLMAHKFSSINQKKKGQSRGKKYI